MSVTSANGKTIVILGAGISGHTAAMILRRKLGAEHKVIVVSPNSHWNWLPSNIWVGVGRMQEADVVFPLAPVYQKLGITFHQAMATEIYPEGLGDRAQAFVKAKATLPGEEEKFLDIPYDYLINATGPKLNFAATPGLGPEGFTHSVCKADHAVHTAAALNKLIEEMRQGSTKVFVVGTGHGTCTCEGAAFEYVFNLEFELRSHGVRDKARIIFLTNEPALGDFGVGGMHLMTGGHVTPGHIFAESLFVERKIEWILGAHVHEVTAGSIKVETLDGTIDQLQFDFAMLLPPFKGVPLVIRNRGGDDISTELLAPSGIMKVDADYTQKPFEDWQPTDWPRTYQTKYKNMFAIGIAFAPPHPISKPQKSPNGVVIAPAPPRTGMPSAVMGRTVAKSIVKMIQENSDQPSRAASLADLGAACVASTGAGLIHGSAASITMYPIVPDFKKYPVYGRSTRYTTGEIGLAGHWIKTLLHYAFLYKAKAKPMWWMIPE